MRKVYLIIGFFLINFCSNDIVKKAEIIHPPVDVTIASTSGTYLVTFYANNTETGFAGYGFFQAADQTSLSTAPSDILAENATNFCTVDASQLSYTTANQIQLGSGTSESGVLCHLSSFTPTSGQYIAVRARVTRDSETWSEPGIVQVP